VDIAGSYPEHATAIQLLLSHINTLRFEGFIQPHLDMSDEQKERHISDEIQRIDDTLKQIQVMSDSVTGNSARIPREVKDFFGSVFKLAEDTLKLARRELEGQLTEVKTEKDDNRNTVEEKHAKKHIRPLWTLDEQKELKDASSALENIKEMIGNYPDNPLKPLLQSSFSLIESHTDLLKKTQEESYDISELREILKEMKSSLDAHFQTGEWLEQLRDRSPETVEILKKIQKVYFETIRVFEKVVTRTVDALDSAERKRLTDAIANGSIGFE